MKISRPRPRKRKKYLSVAQTRMRARACAYSLSLSLSFSTTMRRNQNTQRKRTPAIVVFVFVSMHLGEGRFPPFSSFSLRREHDQSRVRRSAERAEVMKNEIGWGVDTSSSIQSMLFARVARSKNEGEKQKKLFFFLSFRARKKT